MDGMDAVTRAEWRAQNTYIQALHSDLLQVRRLGLLGMRLTA